MSILCFFIAGVIQDTLLVAYQRFVYSNKKLTASITSALIATISILVISKITLSLESKALSLELFAFIAGKIIGTYFSLEYFSKSKQ